ncbi:putative RNA polymerase beta subunit [Pseudomonas phage PA1C]|nr:putative RNA polymerase beta subunit [Pseudomonas phage PA1C]
MRLKIHQFLKNYSLRNSGELLRPRLFPLTKLELPQEVVYQFLDDNAAVKGPSQSDPLFAKLQGKVFIEHITQLETLDGNARRTSLIPTTLEADFRRQHRFFKPLRKDAAVKLNIQNVAVFNYSMLNPLWKYQANFKSNWYRWSNNTATFWKGVVDVHKRFGWNQFIELHIPESMPTFNEFKMLERGTTQALLEKFRTNAVLNVFDLYRFLGDNRSSSYMSIVPKEAYEKINFLIRVQNNFFVINLGQLEAWRDAPEVIAEQETVATESFVDELGLEVFYKPDVMQRRVISLLTTLVEFNNGNDTLMEVEPETPKITDLIEPEDKVDTDDEEVEEVTERAEETEEANDIDAIDDSNATGSNVSTLLDLGMLEVVYDPPPESELEKTTLVIEKDPLETAPIAKAPTLKVETAPVTKSVVPAFNSGDALVDPVGQKAFELYQVGMISGRSFEQAVDDASMYKSIPDPFGSGKTIAEAMTYEEEDFKVPVEKFADKSTITDKSMLGSIHKAMMRKYTKTLLPKDIMQSILSVQAQGVAVTDVRMEEVRDAMNHYQSFTVTVKPIRGRPSQLRFRIPVIDRDGRFRSNGVTYRQRLQRADIPIRKVNPLKVALTSYYNKTFVTRSERAENNYDTWLIRQIGVRARDNSDVSVTDVRYAELDQSMFVLPRVYSALGRAYRSFKNGANEFYFKFDDHAEYFQKTYGISVEALEKDGMVVVGAHNRLPILVDSSSQFYVKEGNELEPMGTMVDILGLNQVKAPLEAILVSVANKELPLGFILGYRQGLSTLLDTLGVQYQSHPRGTRISVSPDDYTLAFSDEILVFSRQDYRATLVLSGLKRYHQSLKKFSRWDFDRRDVYFRLLEEAGMSARYTREIDSLFTSFVDPITKGLLEEMKEPTDFQGLLYRSVELLTNDWSPAEVDGAYMRYRGYERMAGTIYGSLNRAVRIYNNREGSADQQIVMDQHEVWRKIASDPTVATIEDSNPIANLREQEAMTYRGDGGRGSTSMVARTRIYHESDVGVVSESTVDSGDVGVIAYLSPDANFNSMRGTTRLFEKGKDGAAKMLSTGALTGVATTNDDPKRINFVSIQQQQGIYADGYEVTPLRTGYEQIIAQRTSSIFASAAEQDGEVIAVDGHGITVKYADGEIFSSQLGTVHGTAAGVNYPHTLVTTLKKGDKFKRGDTLTFNSKYFTEDRYTPGQVLWKAGVMVRVAFCDNLDTLEDGSVISKDVAIKLNTQTTDIKNITVRFDQSIENLVKVGEHVDLDSILCTIQDPEMAENSLFGAAAIETLKKLSANAPRAKVVGTISKIECYYHGDIEDMSSNLQKIARASDKERADRAKSLNEPEFTGEVDASFRVKGQMLEPDNMVIRIYIDHDIPCGTGDKGVVANQMKTVFSRVMDGRNECEDGTPIGLIFGNTSVEERMVMSPKLIATTTILQQALSKHVAALYRGTTNAKSK